MSSQSVQYLVTSTPPHPLPFPRMAGESGRAWVARIERAAQDAAHRRKRTVMANPDAAKRLQEFFHDEFTHLPAGKRVEATANAVAAWSGYVPPAWVPFVRGPLTNGHPAEEGWKTNTSHRRAQLVEIVQVAAA